MRWNRISKLIMIAVVLLVITVAIAITSYVGFLSPTERTKRHLEFVHKSIDEMHPAILESDAEVFLGWHREGYEKAKSLLSKVRTNADEAALLRFYLAGYQDPHLSGYLDNHPFSKIDAGENLWTGWLLKATSTGYKIIYRKDHEAYPPQYATLVSCNGVPIDDFLQQYYAPYFDRRWHILKARDLAAKALSQNVELTSVLDRPQLKTCTFQINNLTRSFPIHWSRISEEEDSVIRSHSHYRYHPPSLSQPNSNTLWIHATDFSLFTPEAAESQRQLLQTIQTLSRENIIVILDTRGNNGGNSLNGWNIINAVFRHDKQAAQYIINKYKRESQGAQAIYRASWPLYWSREFSFKKIVASEGLESEHARHIGHFLARLERALQTGVTTLYQNENPSEHDEENSAEQDWRPLIKLAVITDKHCVSSCLDFVELTRLLPNTLHLGEPTNADTVYTEIAYMQSGYLKETFNFIVPVKKWNKRLRKDNQPYVPDVIYEGDINNDPAFQSWVLVQIQQHFGDVQ